MIVPGIVIMSMSGRVAGLLAPARPLACPRCRTRLDGPHLPDRCSECGLVLADDGTSASAQVAASRFAVSASTSNADST